ncbi:MAG: hypothetical protein ABIA97_03605 [Candidatus Omnitrophota bacterium]
MTKHLKILLFSLFVAGIYVLNLSPALSQEEGVMLVNEASGEISSIDLENSMLTVKHFKNGQYEDTAIYVDKMTTIEKEYEIVDFTKLTIGDKAEVKYTTDDNDKNIATYIWIESEE